MEENKRGMSIRKHQSSGGDTASDKAIVDNDNEGDL